MPSLPLRLTLGATLTAALVLAPALGASAHVAITPNSAEPGASVEVDFRVPNESAEASTVSVSVALPQDTPFTSVSYQPVPGWTATIATSTLPEPVTMGGNTITEAPTNITWTATDGIGLTSGQYERFVATLSPVPDTGYVLFPVTQTYSDGTVAEWTASAEDASADPTLKTAPVLFVNDAVSDDHGTAPEADGSDETTAAATASTDDLARTFALIALITAALAVLIAALAFATRRARKTT
jgi:uncharacterized protein YcnI